MIAGILRGVMLRFASEYLSNVDVNKLSLWSGHIILQNVNLNVSALTNSLNLPYLRIESGQISRLELNIPWTSLSTKKISIKIHQISLNVSLTDNLVNLNKPPEVSASEETLLSKILANLYLDIEDLVVTLTMQEEANYIAKFSMQELKICSTNNQWQEEFLNPFVTLTTGMAFRIYRKIECKGLTCRVLSGKKDDVLSEVVSSHKFEKANCGGCPLCFAFKSSSYYTLAKLEEFACTLLLFTTSEHTTSQGKYNHVKVLRCRDFIDLAVKVNSGVNVKLNLVQDKMMIRDFWTAQEKFVMPEMQRIEVVQQPTWYSWGKDMLFSPFYCSPAANFSMITDKIQNRDVKAEAEIPSLMVKLRIHNLQELKTIKYVFAAENLDVHNELSTIESSKGSTQRSHTNQSSGNLQKFVLTCYEKYDCGVISVNTVNYSINRDLFDYQCHKVSAKTIRKGEKTSGEALTLEKVFGSVTFASDFLIKLNSDPILLEIPLESLHFLTGALLELKAFYFRLVEPKAAESSDFDFLSLEKENSRQNQGKLIENLKEHASSLAVKLEQKTQECNLLRKTLCQVAGNSGIAGILNIDSKDILSVSEEGKIEETDVTLILTHELLYIVTKEGRVLNKNLISEMVALEEKGTNELCIKMTEGKSIRTTMKNKNDFAGAIKRLFQGLS